MIQKIYTCLLYTSQVELIRNQVGGRKVLLALSGGVDSSVVAALLIKAIGDQLTCVHVNHGLLRKGEPEQVVQVFRHELGANLVYVDAVDRFLDKLAGVADPEAKRKIIGAEFIRVFEEEARKLEGIEFLAQGTICLLYTSMCIRDSCIVVAALCSTITARHNHKLFDSTAFYSFYNFICQSQNR